MTRQLLFSDPLQFAVIWIDARAMVEPLEDPIALEAAAMLKCRKYLVFLEAPDDLPLPRSKHCRYSMLPVATCLRPADMKKGITADMVMPIHPNTEHLRGRTPIHTEPLFPYNNCFFWIESELSVRVKVSPGGYDDKGAITMGAREHLETSRCWMEDFDRLDSFLDGMDAKYAGDSPAIITDVLRSSSTIPALPPPHTFVDNSDESDTDAEDSADEDDDAISRFDPEDLAELKELFSHNPFGWDSDPKARFLPLVDLWLEIEEHFSAAEIPSPVEFYEEQAAITSIMIDSLRRRSVQTPP